MSLIKNSSHPLRPFDSNNWKSKESVWQLAATSYIHLYNIYLTLLSLALIGYGGWLVNKHDSQFADIFLGVACYCFVCAISGWVLPYLMPSKLAAPIYFCLNFVLCLFCLGMFIYSFFDDFWTRALRLDSGAVSRKNCGLWFKEHVDAFNAFTIIGSAFAFLTCASLVYLYLEWYRNNESYGSGGKSLARGPVREAELVPRSYA